MQGIESITVFKPRLGRVIWDLTYACPLRCIHCYSESGRRKSEMLDESTALRLAHKLADAGPTRISFGGGEPLMAKWWHKVADVFHSKGINTAVFTGGWLLDLELATKLVTSVDNVSVSIDGPSAAVHDLIRGRDGSFDRALRAVEFLLKARESTRARCEIAIEFTATRRALPGFEEFLSGLLRQFINLDYVRVGAVIPEGLASEPEFCAVHLLREHEIEQLHDICDRVAKKHATIHTQIQFTDVREFLPSESGDDADSDGLIFHIEPSGQVRAMTNYEAKVGNALTQSIDELVHGIWKWRTNADVLSRFKQASSFAKWGEVTRRIDLDYGSPADKIRILKRN